MRNETNNDNGHEGLPEALYRRYRLERQGASDVATKPGERSATAAGSVEVNVESLFRTYQSQRASSSASAIDDIVDHLNQSAVVTIAELHDQPSVGKNGPTLKPVAGRLGVVKQFFIGAVAASMFAFIVVPQLVQHVADDGIVVAALPPALLENAEHVTTHIGSDRGGSFAFSSSDEPSFVAFRHGVVSVDLRLHLLANQAEAVVPLLGNLVGQQPVSGDAETDSDEIQQSAQYLFDGIRERLNNQELTQRLNAVVASLDGSARNSKQLDWFQFGRSVESVRLSAEYALTSSDLRPLEQALNELKATVKPPNAGSVAGLIDSLYTVELSSPDEYIQAAQLVSLTNDILVLAR